MSTSWRFLSGFMAGAGSILLVGSAGLFWLAERNVIAIPDARIVHPLQWLGWVADNLGWSIAVFSLLIMAFLFTLARLQALLETDAPVNRIVQLDHLADTWTTVFFGPGVIWTAICMRSALIFALGDRDIALSSGAFAMLERMIDVGILLAL